MEFVKTKRGGRKLLLNGYSYVVDKKNHETVYWRCEKRKECNARIRTVNDTELDNASNHSHPPDGARNCVLKVLDSMKTRVAEHTEEITSSVINNITGDLPLSVAGALPKRENLQRMVRRARNVRMKSEGLGITTPSSASCPLFGILASASRPSAKVHSASCPSTAKVKKPPKELESSHQGPSFQSYPGKQGTSATESSVDSLSQHASLSQPTAAKFRKKTGSQFENHSFENKEQKPMAHLLQPSLPTGTQMQVEQHLQVAASHPAPTQPAPRQVQLLAPPVQVTVAKPKPIEKPRPRKKRIFVVADHQRCVMSNLVSLWKSGKLCDAGIGNGSSTVMVHKLVLSAVCPKLLSVFNMDIMSHEFLQVNFPPTVSTEALNAFAEYMYNGILDLDHEILEQLKIIAKRLDMKVFEQLCDSHLPNHMHQPASAASSFTDIPLIQTSMPIPALLDSTMDSDSMQSALSITTQVIKQEISEAELAQVQKDTVAVFGQESEVSSLAPNKSGNVAGFVIVPSIKTEPVGPENDRYGQWSGSSNNQTSLSSPSSITAATLISSVPTAPTEFAIPFSETTNVKFTRLKTPQETPLVSYNPVSGIVETEHSQSSSVNKDSSKPLNQSSDSQLSIDLLQNNNDTIYPVRLFSARGDNLPLLTTDM